MPMGLDKKHIHHCINTPKFVKHPKDNASTLCLRLNRKAEACFVLNHKQYFFGPDNVAFDSCYVDLETMKL